MLLAPKTAPVDVVLLFEINASKCFFNLLQRHVEISKDFNAWEEYGVTIEVFEDAKENITMSTNTLYSVPNAPRQSTGDVLLLRVFTR